MRERQLHRFVASVAGLASRDPFLLGFVSVAAAGTAGLIAALSILGFASLLDRLL
jgi:hypothetical protein